MLTMRALTRLALGLGWLTATIRAFTNPIIPGFNPDPTIIRVGPDYFLATSTFEFFPGVPIYHSTDLISWTNIGHALNRPSQLNLRGTAPSGGVFAPTLRYHEPSRTYYMITTAFDVISPPDNVTRMPRSFYVSTADIWDETSWSDPTYVDQWGFDGDLFFDYDEDKTYLTSTFSEFVDDGNFANWITEIDLSTGNSLSESRVLHTTTVPEELGYPLTEASHLYKMKGWYYMITADSGTEANHKANVYRSKSVEGPWEENPHNPVLWNGRDTSLPVLSTGHADWVETPEGEWYAVFLATRPQNPENGTGYPQLGRETFLSPVAWDEEGWPLFNGGDPIATYMPNNSSASGLLYDLAPPKIWRDDFSADGGGGGGGGGGFRDKRYYTPRTPYKEFRDFTSSPGQLRLHGNPYTLSMRETPAVVMRKQEAINVTFSAELSSFSPKTTRHEAGATVYLSIHFHNEIAVTAHPDTGERCVVAHVRSGEEAALNTTYVLDENVARGDRVRLYIRGRPEGYELGYSTVPASSSSSSSSSAATSSAGRGGDRGGGHGGHNDEEDEEAETEVKYIASVGNKWLQTYVSGWQNFVGTHFGIYNTGTKLPTLYPADFDYIQTELN